MIPNFNMLQNFNRFQSIPCFNPGDKMNQFYARGNQNDGNRGFLLPFLAGVLVTTPFIFLNKNNNVHQQNPYPYYQPYPMYPGYQAYSYQAYPMQMQTPYMPRKQT